MTQPEPSGQVPYRRPPQNILDVLNTPAFPHASLSPTRDTLVLAEPERYPPVAEFARPMLRLAGVRIDPRTNGPARPAGGTGRFTIIPLGSGERIELDLGRAAWGSPDWSPDGAWFALTRTADGSPITLVLVHAATGTVVPVPDVRLNAALTDPVHWLPGSRSLLLATIPGDRGPVPGTPPDVIGPIVEHSDGAAGPVRTYQDLLRNGHDESLFDYYGTSQLVRLVLPGEPADSSGFGRQWDVAPVGEPAMIVAFTPSSDGASLLLSRLVRPYSYLHPYARFPRAVEVWDLTRGQRVHTVAEMPLQDRVPIEGVPTGPRSVRWLPTEPATLFWTEARDDGDPKKQVPHRDEQFTLAAPFDGQPVPVHRTEHRFAGVSWFADGRALVTDYDRERKWVRTVRVTFSEPSGKPAVVFDRSAQDRYNDPGSPLYRTLPNGHRVLKSDGESLLLAGSGAGPDGDRPFLDRFDLDTRKSERLFHCREGMYESVAAVLDDAGGQLLVRRESTTEPPNYVLRIGDDEVSLTRFADPCPDLRRVTRKLITATRADGVGVSFQLYLPATVEPGAKLPTVFWAYPREFASADTAGQVSGSPHRFFLPSSYSHLFFLTRGYAVMDAVSMPIVGPPETANDTFQQQLVMTAEAAIAAACEHGPVDRDRIGVGGHSYGAFMAAGLLAHADLFRAGIARSGSYNRTLTPFGFQNERRTYWEATDVYIRMSPFAAADKMRTPLLLIHGAEDDNPGTFPMQSERMYQAVRGTGGITRLVVLPHEAHGYRARESVEHTLAEMIDWFDRHVKNAPPRPEATDRPSSGSV